jgi:hypothetical protein
MIKLDKENFDVGETIAGQMLPRACPERHIKSDATFCLGLRAGENVDTPEDAANWWGKLHVFLTCQDTAHASGV